MKKALLALAALAASVTALPITPALARDRHGWDHHDRRHYYRDHRDHRRYDRDHRRYRRHDSHGHYRGHHDQHAWRGHHRR